MKVDLAAGLTTAQALELAAGLKVSGSKEDAAKQLQVGDSWRHSSRVQSTPCRVPSR